MSTELAKIVWDQLSLVPEAYKLINSISINSSIYLFGGLVRDYLDERIDKIRDIDIVVQSYCGGKQFLSSYINKLDTQFVKRNRYGGYKITFPENIVIDIWDVESTWAFRNGYFSASISNLLSTVYLNIDSFVYSFNDGSFINGCDKKWNKIKKDGIIDIVFTKGPFEKLNLLRALVYSNKYSLHLSTRLRSIFSRYNIHSKEFYTSLVLLQKEHYGSIIFSEYELSRSLNAILKYITI